MVTTQVTPSSEVPFPLAFPSRSGEVIVAAVDMEPAENKEREFFKALGIERDGALNAATTTQSTISTPSNTANTTTSQTATEIRTGPGGWDKSVDVETDNTTDQQLDRTDDPGAADD